MARRWAWLPLSDKVATADLIRQLNRRMAALEQKLDELNTRVAALEAGP